MSNPQFTRDGWIGGGDVFEEEHHQNVVLVFGRVSGTTEGIACCPEDSDNLVLRDRIGGRMVWHRLVPLMSDYGQMELL